MNLISKMYPVEDFFRNVEFTGVSLSDDGKYMSYLGPYNSKYNIFVRDLETGREWRVTSETQSVSWYIWKGHTILFGHDTDGDENTHLFIVDLNGGEVKELTPFEKVKCGVEESLEEDPDHIIISMNRRDAKVFDFFKCNIRTGELELIYENPGDVDGWYFDMCGNLRFLYVSKGLSTEVWHKFPEDDEFQKLFELGYRDSFSIYFMSRDGRIAYVTSNLNRDKMAIYKFNPETVKFEELMLEDDEVDSGIILFSKITKNVLGVGCLRDKVEMIYLDSDRKALQEELEGFFGDGYQVRVSKMDDSRNRMIVNVWSDKYFGAVYVYDRREKSLSEVGEIKPWIAEEDMVDMQCVEYEARDGLKIHAYLSVPKIDEEPKNLPLVIIPHGGPIARDSWRFDSLVQFLANRGYVILQPNYRGSFGYGKDFMQKGFKQWGRGMQDDLTDGVNWLIDKGLVDPDRVAILGGSYGGYAALAGAAFTPDLYACAIDIVGPSNLFTMLESIPPYWELSRAIEYEEIGDPEKDREMLRSVSPFFHADKIKIPLLVAQGANDPRVNRRESDQIVDEVRKHGIEVIYLLKGDEGHGFSNEANSIELYKEIEKFLARHLGGNIYEPPAGDLNG